MIVFFGFGIEAGGGRPKGQMNEVKLEKQRALAWNNVAQGHKPLGLYNGGTTRLLIHAVGDSSLDLWPLR